jgi:enoyl-CoA hydratase/carnithine racemase
MTEDTILSTIDGAIATLIFHNPDRHNAMSLAMWREAAATLEALAAEDTVRVVILTGAGGKSFVSGADISKFDSERSTEVGVASYAEATEQLAQTLLNYPKPTIAMIRGYCIGGGVNIAVCCDLRVCDEKSRFAVPAAKLGLGYGYVHIQRLQDLVGPQFALEILLTARQFDAAEARQMGLVNRIVPDAEIETYVRGIADTIAANAPLTIRAVKRAVRELLKDAGDRDLGACELLVRQCFESEDYQEGRRAFMEKRKPVFEGR